MSSEHDLPQLPPIATPIAGLYPHQESSIVFTVGRLIAGVRRVLLVAPTGAGKTVLAGALIRYFISLGLRCLFLAHRKELITQASEKLDAAGIDHGVIMADHPRRRPELLVQVASVQTLAQREKPRADVVIIDECFPAGVRVGDRPIDAVRVGDRVPSFDSSSGRPVEGRVTRTFSGPATQLVRVTAGGSAVVCTPGHPFLTRSGWVPAHLLGERDEVLRSDVQPMPSACDALQRAERSRELPPGPVATDGPGLLLRSLPGRVRSGDLGRHHGGDQPAVRVGADEAPEPDVVLRDSAQGLDLAAGDGPHAAVSGRDGAGPPGAGEAAAGFARERLGGGCVGEDGTAARFGSGDPLRAEPRPSPASPGRGGRWAVARRAEGEGAGCREVRGGHWARVDAVEVLEPGRDGTFGGLCPGGRVFNLEVEGTHTYVAGGFVVHNCHHAIATSYQTALDANPDALTIGLSATPWGANGRGLGGLFEELVLVATPAQLLAQGYLVPFDGFSFDVPDLSSVRVRGSDYDEGQLARAVNTSYVVGGIVERWEEHARGVRTVVFTVDIEHSRNIVARFLAAGVPAEHLDGDVPIAERKAILARLKAGETLVVSNCGVLCEGWDMPECACCILARPTQSLVLYLQQAGRVLRLAPGKTRARIHDHAGCLTRFGLPDAERDYSLNADTRKSAPTEAGVQTCPLCARVFPLSARHCPDCYVPETRGEPGIVVETDGHLVEIAELRLLEELRRIPELLLATKAAEYLRLKEEALRNGYKPGWAYFRYRETFHEEPKFPRGFLEACRPATTAFGPLDQLALTTGGHTP